MLAGCAHDAVGVEVVEVIGDDVEAALGDLFEDVAVGNQTHPFVPRVVARFEVDVDRITLRQEAHVLPADERAYRIRETAGDHPQHLLEDQGGRANHGVGGLFRQHRAQRGVDRVDPRHGEQVTR